MSKIYLINFKKLPLYALFTRRLDQITLIFDRTFHIKAFYSQIWCFASLKNKNTAFCVEYLLYLTLKNILS